MSQTASLSKEEAIAIYDAGQWMMWDDVEIVRRQLFEERLIMPFSHFHAAIERVLNHSVFTHQFGSDKAVELMKAEFLALHPAN